MDATIKKAQDRISFVRGSKEDLHSYQMREMAMFDFPSGMNNARRDGLAKGIAEGIAKGIAKGKVEGRKEGRKEGMEDVAKKLLNLHLPVTEIVKVTGLTPEQILLL